MELSQKENTKRIAKNTLMLYVRMLFGMLVSLYTSRVVLQALGVEDYGIYNVVGGVVAMFSMISSSLSSSVSRFLTFELGKGNREGLKRVFSTSLSIHVVLALVIVLLGETIGLWFLNTHMTIPENRLYAANWVFQASIFTFVINLLSVPFSASIVSHERMSAFAYIGILDVILRLLIVLFIAYSGLAFDRLIVYALLLVGVVGIMQAIYWSYCTRNFEECRFKLSFDVSYWKEISSFAGWNFIGCTAGLLDEVNKFHTGRGLPCMFKDIVSDELFDAVKARIEGIEANLEAGNYDAAYNDLDIHSVIDYFFIQELAFNDEYKHPKSVYMYIDGLGKLTAGPVWDFDWQTFVNYDNVEAMINKYGCDTYRCRKGDEWLYGASKLAEKPTWPWQDYDYENDKPYMWYPLLFKDANFCQAVQERWTIIYPALLTVESKIEELADQNRLSDTFNSVMWPQIQVKSSGTAAFNGDEEMTFDEAVASMKQAYRERLNWMNTNIMNGSFVIDAE